MTRTELIAKLAEHFPQLLAKDAEVAVNMILDAMTARLVSGERIEIRGFVDIRHRPPRNGRNPRTGENVPVPVPVPAKAVLHFKAGRELRERVDR